MSNEPQHIALTQGMNSENNTLNVSVNGEAVIEMPSHEDVQRLETKIDTLTELVEKLLIQQNP